MKFKLKNLGVKESTKGMVTEAAPKREARVVYPSVSLSSKNIDGLSSVALDKECTLVFKARVKEIRRGADWNTDKGIRAEFELIQGMISPIGYGMTEKAGSIREAGQRAKEGNY